MIRVQLHAVWNKDNSIKMLVAGFLNKIINMILAITYYSVSSKSSKFLWDSPSKSYYTQTTNIVKSNYWKVAFSFCNYWNASNLIIVKHLLLAFATWKLPLIINFEALSEDFEAQVSNCTFNVEACTDLSNIIDTFRYISNLKL